MPSDTPDVRTIEELARALLETELESWNEFGRSVDFIIEDEVAENQTWSQLDEETKNIYRSQARKIWYRLMR